MNITTPRLSAAEAYYHGAHLVFLDAFGSGALATWLLNSETRSKADQFIKALLHEHGAILSLNENTTEMDTDNDRLFGICPFFIEKGN